MYVGKGTWIIYAEQKGNYSSETFSLKKTQQVMVNNQSDTSLSAVPWHMELKWSCKPGEYHVKKKDPFFGSAVCASAVLNSMLKEVEYFRGLAKGSHKSEQRRK